MSSLTVERVSYKPNPNPTSNSSFYIPQITTLTAPRPPNVSTYKSSANSNPFDDDDEGEAENTQMEVEMSTANQSSTETSRDFEVGDMARVMDFDNLPDPPQSSNLLLSLENFEGKEDGTFPERFVCLRGSYLFFFEAPVSNLKNRGNKTLQSLPPPLGCVPLARTIVEFPEGGRRAFREHAFTPAKNGYEFVISHTGDEKKHGQQGNSVNRPRIFVVAESLNRRDDWANAIRLRSEIRKRDTGLRPKVMGSVNVNDMESETSSLNRRGNNKVLKKIGNISRRMMMSGGIEGQNSLHGSSSTSASAIDSNITVNEPFLKDALERFGLTDFDDKNWVYRFYEQNNEFDSPKQVRKLEDYQKAVKQGVRGAVLEQYKYFVEASREMTVMGKEVQSLKTLVDGQVRLIDQLKSIEFADVFRQGTGNGSDSSDDEGDFKPYQDDDEESLSSAESSESESNRIRKNPRIKRAKMNRNRIFHVDGAENHQSRTDLYDNEDGSNVFEIPAWLNDVTEDILAFIKECRYSNATDLILKAKTELADIFNQVSFVEPPVLRPSKLIISQCFLFIIFLIIFIQLHLQITKA